MKRRLYFDYSPDENKYTINENGICIFHIDGKTLEFVSLEFYNGIYAGNKSTAIDFENRIDDKNADLLHKGCYIFNWIKEIFNAIEAELPDNEKSEVKCGERANDA